MRTALLLLSLVAAAIPSPAAVTFAIPPRASGSKDAPIVIEVFGDFQCPFCRELHLRTMTRVIDDYCSKGKVYVIHRDFPAPMHKYAPDAARWALACASIGKYEAIANTLFQKQDAWSTNGNIEPVIASVLTPAELKMVKQRMITNKAEIEAAIQSDVALGAKDHFSGIPVTKIYNKGKIVSVTTGVISYAILKRAIDQQLAK